MLCKFRNSFVPSNAKEGLNGIVVSETVSTLEIAPFLKRFQASNKRLIVTKYDQKRAPYTGKEYLNINFQINDRQKVKELFSMFENFVPPTEVLILTHFMSVSQRIRVEEPREKLPFFFKSDKNSIEQQIEYNLSNFGDEKCNRYLTELYLGEAINGRFCFFEINYAINLEGRNLDESLSLDIENGIVCGDLSFRFYFKTSLNGKSEGTPIGDDKLEVENLEEEQNVQIDNMIEVEKPQNDFERMLAEMSKNFSEEEYQKIIKSI